MVQEPSLPINAVPCISQRDQYVTQMQFIQHKPILDSFAQYLCIDMARTACFISRQLIDCRPYQSVRIVVGKC